MRLIHRIFREFGLDFARLLRTSTIGPSTVDRGAVDRVELRHHAIDCCDVQRQSKKVLRLDKILKKLTARSIDVSRASRELRSRHLT